MFAILFYITTPLEHFTQFLSHLGYCDALGTSSGCIAVLVPRHLATRRYDSYYANYSNFAGWLLYRTGQVLSCGSLCRARRVSPI